MSNSMYKIFRKTSGRIKILIFWYVKPPPSVDGYHCLGGTCLSLHPSALKLEATESSKAAVSYLLHCVTFMVLTLMAMRISYSN